MEVFVSGQDLWNTKNLDAPPITTYRVSTPIDTSQLKETFWQAVAFFRDRKQLQIESTFLSTSVFRMKQKFRSDKGFKCMQKLDRALKNYFEVHLSSILENFHGLLPKNARAGNYLPTRNMLDFILIRIQGSVMLLKRIIETCKIGAFQMEERIAIGQLWRLSFVMYSVMSRVCFICEEVIGFLCDFYRNVLPWRRSIGNVNSPWLSDDYRFPNDLKSWMNLDSDQESTKESVFPLQSFQISDESNDVEIIEESVEKSAFQKLLEGDDDDLGIPEDQSEPILPEETRKIKKTKRKRRKDKLSDDISPKSTIASIQTCMELRKFFEKETKIREMDKSNSIFGHLDRLQWNMLQNGVKRFLKKGVKDANKSQSFAEKAKEIIIANLKG